MFLCSAAQSCLTLCPWTVHRLPCPSLSSRVCSSWCPLSRWCHPTISSSVIPFSCFQSFPELGSFPMNWLFVLGGQSIGASTLASVLPMNIHGWFPLGLIGLISLLSKEFGGFQHLPVNSCSVANFDFGILEGEDEHKSFYSTILKE